MLNSVICAWRFPHSFIDIAKVLLSKICKYITCEGYFYGIPTLVVEPFDLLENPFPIIECSIFFSFTSIYISNESIVNYSNSTQTNIASAPQLYCANIDPNELCFKEKILIALLNYLSRKSMSDLLNCWVIQVTKWRLQWN